MTSLSETSGLSTAEENETETGVFGHLKAYLRVGDLGFMARRYLGLPVWRSEDFLPRMDARESQRLVRIALALRGDDYRPAFFVHGVLPRSGTNFVANAIALHPHTSAYPRQMFEFPALRLKAGAVALRSEFLALFPRNQGSVSDHELLGYLISGWMRCLQHEAGDRALLFKCPHAQNIGLFSSLYPRDKLVLCLRDGRDVIASSMKTFSGSPWRKSFGQMAAEWAAATEAMLTFEAGRVNTNPNVLVVRYEDMVREPNATISRLLTHLGLNEDDYPFDQLAAMPVFGSSTNQAEGTSRWQPTAADQNFSPIGRWQSWPPRQKRAFERIAGDALAQAGYA
ncbi:MAG: sulfotransferase [Geminicoccaceae bacterium]